MKLLYTILFLLFANCVHSQNGLSKNMIGKIVSNSSEIESVNISNQTSERATISDSKGNFVLNVSVGDLLFFSAVNLRPLHYTIQKEDFVKEIFVIKLFSRMEQLEEVIVEKSTITTESVGIIPKGVKTYTPSERKLYTATGGGSNQYGTNTIVSLDAIINSFSGRTAMLKKEIEVEKKEKSLFRTEYMFEVEYYVESLKIPKEYVKGFQYYCVEDAAFADVLQSKNKTLAKFLLVDLSKKYLALINQK